jgi:alpha-glucosidase
MGVKGVKVDFFDRNDVDSVAWVHEVVRKAAERRLLVNLHGVFSPFGLERTYPNLMTMEGVMGAEYNKWSRRVTPQHNVTLPFTRMVAGPMDYTVGCFDNVTSERFEPRNLAPMVLGTRAHHLAMYILYQSALQMVSDYPDAIRGKPGSEFIRNVPAAWDETRGLLGEVGEFVVVARRKGSTWYLGAMTGSDARTLEVPLDFLAGEAEATTYADGPDAATEPKSLTVDRRPVKPTDTLRLELAPAGGFSAVLKAIK